MTTFDEREHAFENKYAHDEEMQFKANARRNKMLGLWAADLMGMTGSDAKAYAKTVVLADLQEAGHEDVVRKITADLQGKVTSDAIREKMDKLLPKAKSKIMKKLAKG